MSSGGTRETGRSCQALPNVFRQCIHRKYFGKRNKPKSDLNSGVGKFFKSVAKTFNNVMFVKGFSYLPN